MSAALAMTERPEPDDATYVTAFLAGDVRAADRLFRRHGPRILRLCTRILGQREDAEDATHEAFMRALEQLPKLRERERFAAWVTRIAVMESRSRLRKQRLRRALGLRPMPSESAVDQLVSHVPSPEVMAELERLQAALERLSAEARIAWVLRHVEGVELSELAEHLNVSLATAKRRLKSADDFIARHAQLEHVHVE